MYYRCALIGFLFIFTFSSCVRKEVLYNPELPFVPLHKEKGDVQVSAGYQGPSGYNLSASYALSDHLAVQARGTYGKYNTWRRTIFPTDTLHISLYHLRFNGGISYYHHGSDKENNVYVFASMGGGGGFGERIWYYERDIRGYSHRYGNFLNLYGQIGMGVRGKWYSMIVGTQLEYFNYPTLFVREKVTDNIYVDRPYRSQQALLLQPYILQELNFFYGLSCFTQFGFYDSLYSQSVLKSINNGPGRFSGFIFQLGVQFKL